MTTKISTFFAGATLLALSVTGLMFSQEIKTAPSKQGKASPHQEFIWDFGGKKISITYGRPYAKGRKVFGTLEPYNKVWRTGADEATILKTDTDIMLGNLHVPKGSYSLYSTFTADSHTLIVNKQLGQWGTEYNQSQDFGRTPMKVEKAPKTVEQLTYAIDKKSNTEGTLKVMWDDRIASVPLMIH